MEEWDCMPLFSLLSNSSKLFDGHTLGELQILKGYKDGLGLLCL